MYDELITKLREIEAMCETASFEEAANVLKEAEDAIEKLSKEPIELKPCPFCGRIPIIKSDDRYPRPECERITAYEVVCQNYNCIIYDADNKYYRSEEEAIKAWNRRVET